MRIRIERSGFNRAVSRQRTAEANLRTSHSAQQRALGELGLTWKGTAGTSFRECVRTVSNQTLMGILMIANLKRQTEAALSNFDGTDKNSSRLL